MEDPLKTYHAKPGEVTREWLLVDATDVTLGRLASEVAQILKGKRKPQYTPHVDTGDFVIAINADKVTLTGRKREQKQYIHHSGYPGGLKVAGVPRMMEEKPGEIVRAAVRRMLPKNNLGRKLIKKFKVYAGPDHPHKAQQPEPLVLNT